LSLVVKICGLTREADVAAAVEAGANAVGFVFHEASPRNVNPARAAELAGALPPNVLRVAVTLRPSSTFVERILDEFMPDVWQSDFGDFESIRIPDAVRRWPVLRSGGHAPSPLPHTLLFDASISGHGRRADWRTAAALARRSLLIIGGGLNPATVGHAVHAIRPLGVDVSSGVEHRAGVKDAMLIREFVAEARAAERRLDS
jgi:phosphoribosylanthranilate isomerase